MKTLHQLLIVILFIPILCYGQTPKNITVYRGDKTVINFTMQGNVSIKPITFVVKASKELSAPRLIQKKNIYAGGSTSQITASYSAPSTTVSIILNPEDTRDLTSTLFYYDMITQDTVDSPNEYTLSYGNLTVLQDVQTPFDGTNLPSGGTRVTTVSLDNGTKQDEMVTWDATNHRWSPTGSILPQAQKDSIGAMIRDSLRIQNPPYVLSIVRPKQIEDITFDFLFKDIIIDSIQGTTYDSSFTMNLFYGNYIASGGTAIYPTVQTVSAVNPSYNSIIGGGVIPKNNYLRIYINPSGIIGEYYVIKIFYH